MRLIFAVIFLQKISFGLLDPQSNRCLFNRCTDNCTQCEIGCKAPFWGHACDKHCSRRCKKRPSVTPCDWKEGTCIFGCQNRYYGLYCKERWDKKKRDVNTNGNLTESTTVSNNRTSVNIATEKFKTTSLSIKDDGQQVSFEPETSILPQRNQGGTEPKSISSPLEHPRRILTTLMTIRSRDDRVTKKPTTPSTTSSVVTNATHQKTTSIGTLSPDWYKELEKTSVMTADFPDRQAHWSLNKQKQPKTSSTTPEMPSAADLKTSERQERFFGPYMIAIMLASMCAVFIVPGVVIHVVTKRWKEPLNAEPQQRNIAQELIDAYGMEFFSKSEGRRRKTLALSGQAALIDVQGSDPADNKKSNSCLKTTDPAKKKSEVRFSSR